jgi:hypothetical protein
MTVGNGSIVGLNAGGLPDASIVQADLASGVAGNGPAFGAYSNTNQTVSNNTGTVLSANIEEFDTAGCYNNTGSTVTLNGLSVPAYSFCPNIAGYYQINMSIQFGFSSLSRGLVQFLKNGSTFKRITDLNSSINSICGGTLVYLNGTGDYVQAQGYLSGTGTLTFNGGTADVSWFNGVMVRSA